MLTGLINHPDEESHTRVLEASPEQCSALGKDWIPSCMCKWSWTSSKVIPTISKTCFLQLRSIGGIGKLQCFLIAYQMFQRFGATCNIYQYIRHLYLARTTPLSGGTSGTEPRKHWTARPLSWPSEEQLHTLWIITVVERKELASLLTAVGVGLRGVLPADPAGYFLTLSILECQFPAHHCVLSY